MRLEGTTALNVRGLGEVDETLDTRGRNKKEDGSELAELKWRPVFVWLDRHQSWVT